MCPIVNAILNIFGKDLLCDDGMDATLFFAGRLRATLIVLHSLVLLLFVLAEQYTTVPAMSHKVGNQGEGAIYAPTFPFDVEF